MIAEVAGLDGPQLDDALREAIDHKVLVSHGDSYVFRHALLAEAVHDDLLPGQRRRLHAAFLAALTGPGGPGPAREMALHAEAAGDLATAFTASVRAGRDAVRISGYDEAAGHFRARADVPRCGTRRRRCRRLVVDAVDALVASGQLRTATHLIREHLDQLPDSDVTGRGRLLVALGDTLYYSDADDEALEASGQALEVLPDEPTDAASEGRGAARAHDRDRSPVRRGARARRPCRLDR